MRKTRKATIVIGSTAGALALGGVAFAYWSTTGSGSGSAATTDGTSGYTLVFSDNAPTGLAPGIAATNLNVTVKNTGDQSAYVAGVQAKVVAPEGSSCDPAWFEINGQSAASFVDLNWTGVDLAKDELQTSDDDANTIQFIDDPTTPQNVCKGVEMTIAYTSN
jgi:hypothetical protein